MKQSGLLVVIADSDRRRQVQSALATEQAVWASDLNEGLSKAPGRRCIVIDSALPGCHGVEAALRLKAAAPMAALVLLAAEDDETAARQAIRAGVQDVVVPTPSALELLPRTLRHAAQRHQALKEAHDLDSEERALYRCFLELAPDLVCLCIDGALARINPAGATMLEAASTTSCLGLSFAELTHPDYRDIFDEGFDALFAEGAAVPVKMVTLAGKILDVELRALPLGADKNGRTLILGRDITPVTAATGAVAAREHRIRAIMDTVMDGIITIEEDGIIVDANRSVERIFGYSRQELLGASVQKLMPRPLIGGQPEVIRRYLETAARVSGRGREVQAQRKDGSALPIHLTIAEVRVDRRRLFTGTVRDLSEKKIMAQKVRHLAHHDPLTDLPNRTLLIERLAHAVNHARLTNQQVAMMSIDLAGFTTVNDSLGHDAGNVLLLETALRLKRAATDLKGTAARLGGDEFAVLLPHLADKAAVELGVDRVRRDLSRPYLINGVELEMEADVGVSVFPHDGSEALELLRTAEMALHEVKRQPDQRLGYFDSALSFAVSERLKLERSLKSAVESEQFELFYQPQVRLSDYRLIGAEALIRWRHPELGMVGPDRFIPLAEETGLIVPMGRWVLESACRQLTRWSECGMTDLRMGVNISSRQFRDADLPNWVADAIRSSGVDPSLLDLELTESMLMADGDETLRQLHALADLGVTLSIDDFGTGYSSLAYLKRFPVHTVKIDRAFVRDLESDKDGRVIANAIISLAHSLSLKTIAEGVETQAQAGLLADQGCDEIQGFLIGRPLPRDVFMEFAASYDPKAMAALSTSA